MKKFFFCALAGAIGFAGAKTYEHSQKNISSDLLLQNVEALSQATDETGEKFTCYNSITSKDGCQVRYCPTCTYIDGTDRWYSPADECRK